MYQMNTDISNITVIIGIIIAVVIVGSIIIMAIRATSGRLPSVFRLFFEGMEGKIVLTLIVIAIGCVAIRFITGMTILILVAKMCIALCVVVFMFKLIRQIFSK